MPQYAKFRISRRCNRLLLRALRLTIAQGEVPPAANQQSSPAAAEQQSENSLSKGKDTDKLGLPQLKPSLPPTSLVAVVLSISAPGLPPRAEIAILSFLSLIWLISCSFALHVPRAATCSVRVYDRGTEVYGYKKSSAVYKRLEMPVVCL